MRLQSRQYVDQVRLGLCQQRRASRHTAHASGAAALHGVCADLRKGCRGKGRAAALQAQRLQPHGAQPWDTTSGRGGSSGTSTRPRYARPRATRRCKHTIPPRRCIGSLPALQRAALSRAVPAAAVCRRASTTNDPCSPPRHSTAPAQKPTVHLAPAPGTDGGFEMALTNYTQTVPTNFSLNGTKVPVQSGKCHRTYSPKKCFTLSIP